MNKSPCPLVREGGRKRRLCAQSSRATKQECRNRQHKVILRHGASATERCFLQGCASQVLTGEGKAASNEPELPKLPSTPTGFLGLQCSVSGLLSHTDSLKTQPLVCSWQNKPTPEHLLQVSASTNAHFGSASDGSSPQLLCHIPGEPGLVSILLAPP